jgi:hypothetical protein
VGDGTFKVRPRPTQCLLPNVARIYAGSTAAVQAFTKDGTRYAWGAAYYGMFGNGRRQPSSSRPVKIIAK